MNIDGEDSMCQLIGWMLYNLRHEVHTLDELIQECEAFETELGQYFINELRLYIKFKETGDRGEK